MGSFLSKPAPPAVKPRNKERTQAASNVLAEEDAREQLQTLAENIQGTVLLAPWEEDALLGGPDHADAEAYHQQRERTFYFNDANYPACIILPETAQDVSMAVQLVGKLSKKDPAKYVLCVAGGCHSSFCMKEKTIVIDLERMNKATVNIEGKTIKLEGGSKLENGNNALKGTGLGFPTGTNGDTGVSGLTMAGGAGYLGGQAGFACDNVVQAEVVLPSGEIVVATDDNNYADLLRALRGGGGNFGVVTEWTFKLLDVSNSFAGTVVHFAPTQARVQKVIRNWAQLAQEDMPDAGCSIAVLPVGAPVFVSLYTMIGDEVKEAQTYKDVPFLKKGSELGALFCLSNDLSRKDYHDEICPMLEPVQTKTYGSAIGAMIYSLDNDLLDALVHFARVDIPGKNTKPVVLIMAISGEMRRNDGSKSSIRHRKALAWIIFEAAYEPHATEEQIHAVEDWAKRGKQRIIELGGEDGPHNFCDSDGKRIKYFTDEQRTFLEGAKQKYDPDNMFSVNRNIVVKHTE